MDLFERLLLQRMEEIEKNRITAMMNGTADQFPGHKAYIQALQDVRAVIDEVRSTLVKEQ